MDVCQVYEHVEGLSVVNEHSLNLSNMLITYHTDRHPSDKAVQAHRDKKSVNAPC